LVFALLKVGPLRFEDYTQGCEHRQGQQHANKQQVKGFDVGQGVLGADKAGTPKQYEDKWSKTNEEVVGVGHYLGYLFLMFDNK